MLAEICQILDEKIMNLRTGVCFADKKMFVFHVFPIYRLFGGERMTRWQNHKNLFRPKMFSFTTCRRSLACEKRDIDPKA